MVSLALAAVNQARNDKDKRGMALVNSITFSLIDYSGDKRTVRVFTPATATLAELQNLSNAVAAELDAITGMLITGASVNLQLTLPGTLKASAVEDVDAERGVNWTFAKLNSNYSYTIRTPGATDAIVDGENLVPTADTNDWLTVMLDGDATTEPTDEYANDLIAATAQKVTFHK